MKQLKDINWNHLYYFYETARLRSIKKVSELTKNSPSTISEQVKRLETDLNTPLFNRSREGFILTQQGRNLFKHAQVIFEEGYRVLEQFSTDEVGGYPVSVGVDRAILSPISSGVIASYWDLYTQYGMVNTLRQGDHNILIQNVLLGNIDWGLSLKPSKRKSLDSGKVTDYTLQLCCAKFIYDSFKKKKDLITYLPFINTAGDDPFKHVIETHLRKSRLFFNETCYTENYSYLINLVETGRAISYLPSSVIKANKALKAFSPDSQIPVPVYAIWKVRNEKLISIKTLKTLLGVAKLPRASYFHQLQVSEVPKTKLIKKEN